MNPKTRQKIKDSALLIEKYAKLPGALLSISESLDSKKKKELLAIAALIELIPKQLFDVSLEKTLDLYQLLQQGYPEEQLAVKLDESPQTVRQRINSLKAGGIKLKMDRSFKVKPCIDALE